MFYSVFPNLLMGN